MSFPCILCGGTDTTIQKLGGAKIRRSLEEHFGGPVPAEVSIIDYDMLECARCGLISALPMIPGDASFYEWVTHQPEYYPTFRWEWGIVVERIVHAAASHPIAVLDVGCGSGDFLSLLTNLPGVDAWGLDATTTSVEAAKARGLNAVRADINEFLSLNPGKRFDFVTSFHCVEHVENPVEFMQNIKKLLKPDAGIALVSAPLSPMSFEHTWFDPLNHPPHHLSRWSTSALERLAGITGFDISITSSPPRSIPYRAMRTLILAKIGKLRYRGAVQALALAVRNFPDFVKECVIQSRRPRVGNDSAGDAFLAAFTLPRSGRK